MEPLQLSSASAAATLADATWQTAPHADPSPPHPAHVSWMCFSVTLCGHEIHVCGLPMWSLGELWGAFRAVPGDAGARRETIILLLAGIAAGLGGGSIGINGPPIVVAFTLLRASLSKDDMRAISVAYFLTELVAVRLPLLVASGLLNVPAVTVVGIAGAALVGLGVGSTFRSYVDTDAIIVVLVVLVHVSAWIMLVGTTATAVSVPVAAGVSGVLGGVLLGGWAARRAWSAPEQSATGEGAAAGMGVASPFGGSPSLTSQAAGTAAPVSALELPPLAQLPPAETMGAHSIRAETV